MTSTDILMDGFGRVRESVHAAVDGLSPEELAYRVDEAANSIAWLVWHLTRVQDDHIAGVAGLEQVWTAKGFVDRFGLPFGRLATGYGDNADDVAAVRVESGELLTAYHDAVYQQTVDFVRDLTDADLPRVVDEGWDPPVTLGVRLVSVIDDDLEHVGQAAFVRGILLRRR
ncbi:MAG TPA: DUF664 domain-containing protein [Pseudonocardiaceae bacterium]|jgi:uncharacterized damage-inducible protein DinB